MHIVLGTSKYKITSYFDNFLIILIICIIKQLFRFSQVPINEVLLYLHNLNKLKINKLGKPKKLLFNNGGTLQSLN